MRRLLLLPFLGGLMGPQLPSGGPANIRVEELRIYPVKSCRGIPLRSSQMAPTGLKWDRTLAIVDHRGQVQTQRQRRRLATLAPSIDAEAQTLTLEADGMSPLQVPLQGQEADGCFKALVRKPGGRELKMPVWQYGEEVTRWLSTFLAGSPGLSLRGEEEPASEELFHLVRFDEAAGFARRVRDGFGGSNAVAEDVVAFPDLFPILLTAQESLQDLNSRVDGMDITMDRFRPNIVVSGAPTAFDEDHWAIVEIGEGDRQLSLRCLEQDPRCQVPSINQQTGERSPNFEPTTTLRRYRQLKDQPSLFGEGPAGLLAQAGPMFGIYACHGGMPGELCVGDTLRVVERRDADTGSLHEHWTRKRSRI